MKLSKKQIKDLEQIEKNGKLIGKVKPGQTISQWRESKQKRKPLLQTMLEEQMQLSDELNNISRTVVDMMLYDFGHSKKQEKEEITYLIGEYKTIQEKQWRRDVRIHEMSKSHQ
jgi:hypothetical protein